MQLYPFKLSAIIKQPIWGGTRLLREWGKTADGETIGESWELAVRQQEKSVIQNGVYAGRTLEEILKKAGGNTIAPDFSDTTFPLLVKLIDAGDRLSVQVHPDDDYAARVEQDRGKTEMWYIVEADPGAELIFGLQEGVTSEDFAEAVRAGDCESVLRKCPVSAGETYFIPSGMPHAIGRGILIAEIQQNCDLTYRVYDYDRLQADGSKRELHVEKALDVVRPFTEEEVDAIRYARRSDTLANGELLADCPYFRVERVQVRGARPLPACAEMRHALCLEGAGELLHEGERYPIAKGDSYLLPPMSEATLTGDVLLLVSGI